MSPARRRLAVAMLRDRLGVSERWACRVCGQHRSTQRREPELAKELGVSENTYHRWRNQYGGMKANDVKRLKELERENVQLKAIVADQALECRALQEVSRGNW